MAIKYGRADVCVIGAGGVGGDVGDGVDGGDDVDGGDGGDGCGHLCLSVGA